MALRAIAALLCARLSSSLLLRGGTRRVALSMRDSSSVTWFKAGDRVRVTESVVARGEDLLGRTGTVTDTWTKCEEDPHCCCAELAEETAAVHVRFSSGDGASFEYYFAESELARLRAENGTLTTENDGLRRMVVSRSQLLALF